MSAKKPTADDYERMLARMRTELTAAQRGYAHFYEKNRLLENRIRAAIVIGERLDTDKLYALRVSVPKQPRKKWSWRTRLAR